jgi:hypothetical protein
MSHRSAAPAFQAPVPVSAHPKVHAGAAGPHSPPRRRWLGLSAAALVGLALPGARAAYGLPAPTGRVVLSIDGRVSRVNTPGRADFDMDMIAALPQHSFEARTPWYANARRFTGPLLRDLLEQARAEGTTLRLTALNDYRVDMPAEDAQRFGVIVARLLDGQPMAVRDKGPLFIVYPFHDVPALRSATYYGRSAWQLRTITVL